MRTYQSRFAVDDDAQLRAYAGVFGRALRHLHASRHSGNVLAKPRFMQKFGLTSRQYNAVKFSLDGMESSIVALQPGRVADLQQRIKAADKKLAKLLDPKPKKTRTESKKSVTRTFEDLRAQAARTATLRAFKIHNITRRRAGLGAAAGRTRGARTSADLLRLAQALQRPTSSCKKTASLLTATGLQRGKRGARRNSLCSGPKTKAAAVKAV